MAQEAFLLTGILLPVIGGRENPGWGPLSQRGHFKSKPEHKRCAREKAENMAMGQGCSFGGYKDQGIVFCLLLLPTSAEEEVCVELGKGF